MSAVKECLADRFIDQTNPTSADGGTTVTVQAVTDGFPPDPEYKHGLFRFDPTGISKTNLQKVIFRFYGACPPSDSINLEFWLLKRDWIDGQQSWNNWKTGSAWQTPGALGANDRLTPAIATKTIPDTSGTFQWWEVELDKTTFETWIDSPSTYHGILVTTTNSDAQIAIYSMEHGSGNKPYLYFLYEPEVYFVDKASTTERVPYDVDHPAQELETVRAFHDSVELDAEIRVAPGTYTTPVNGNLAMDADITIIVDPAKGDVDDRDTWPTLPAVTLIHPADHGEINDFKIQGFNIERLYIDDQEWHTLNVDLWDLHFPEADYAGHLITLKETRATDLQRITMDGNVNASGRAILLQTEHSGVLVKKCTINGMEQWGIHCSAGDFNGTISSCIIRNCGQAVRNSSGGGTTTVRETCLFENDQDLVDASGGAITYVEINNISDDPDHYDPDAFDFRLWEYSPCVGTGEGGVNMGSIDELVAVPAGEAVADYYYTLCNYLFY